MVDIPRTLGALLVGGLVASTFSGIVTVQSFVYFKSCPTDPRGVKILVASVWILDIFHTIFVDVTLWDYLILHFGDLAKVDSVSWSLPLTIASTATLTFLVHCFFIHRIYKFSRNNLLISIPLASVSALVSAFLVVLMIGMVIRVFSRAYVSALPAMFHARITLRSLKLFVERYNWSFTSGLALSSLVDILITGLLCYMLMAGRKKNSSVNHILDSLILYAFENGALTCTATIIAMISWLTMPTNLVFMGLHFVISKFYANSLLATLNARRKLQQQSHSRFQSSSGDCSLPVVFSDPPSLDHRTSRVYPPKSSPLRITVEESMIRTVDSVQLFSQTRPSTANTENGTFV